MQVLEDKMALEHYHVPEMLQQNSVTVGKGRGEQVCWIV